MTYNFTTEKDDIIGYLNRKSKILEEENERLNNIINGIEKYIELEIEHCYNEGSTIGEFNKICDISSKLQELKENK